MQMVRFLRILALLALLTALAAQGGRPLPFGTWHRLSDTPVIVPHGNTWESAGTFNPAVAMREGKIVMLYRAQDKQGTSRLGYAESADGIHFTRRDEPVLSPTEEYEKDGGVEDPRLVQFGDTYYLTYTGYNKKDAQRCLATSRDLIHWDRKGVILPAYKGNWNVAWTKSGAIVPEKIDGKYWMYFLGTTREKTDETGLAYSTDLVHWTEATKTPVLPRRPGDFDSRVVTPPGCSRVLTFRYLRRRNHGRRTDRSPTWCSWKEWCNEARSTCFTMAARTNILAPGKFRHQPRHRGLTGYDQCLPSEERCGRGPRRSALWFRHDRDLGNNPLLARGVPPFGGLA